jgi:hypothetical protein
MDKDSIMKITNVQNPKYLFADNNKILCQIKIDNNETWQDYLASSDDIEVHGQILFAELLSGKHGTIASYVAPIPTAEENKQTAIQLLQATDWTQISSVSDSALSNPYLANKLAFDQYRNSVRQYAVYPVEGNITWATVPTANWAKV